MGDLVGLFVEVVAARSKHRGPHAPVPLGNQGDGEGAQGQPARFFPVDHLPFAAVADLLLGLQLGGLGEGLDDGIRNDGAACVGLADVAFHHPHVTDGDVHRFVVEVHVEQVAVDPVVAGRQYRELGPLLASGLRLAFAHEVERVEVLLHLVSGPGVCQVLALSQRPAVEGGYYGVLPLGHLHHGLLLELIEHPDERAEMEPGRQDLRLGPFLSPHRDDAPCGHGVAQVDALEVPHLVGFNDDETGGHDHEKGEHKPDDAHPPTGSRRRHVARQVAGQYKGQNGEYNSK